MKNSYFLPKITKIKLGKRNINRVPFVELFNSRVQGVISAGSSKKRVYVSFFDAKSLSYSCRTNNNRRCGGLGGWGPCKHLNWLMEEAVKQYGTSEVAKFLELPIDSEGITHYSQILQLISGTEVKAHANEVFSRFLGYLKYLELAPSLQPHPDMVWFL